MERRNFLKTTAFTTAFGAVLPSLAACNESVKQYSDNKILNAYYFRAHTYTLVPRQVREDLKWMADIGTNVVSVAVLEQDLFAAVENIEFICNEAEKLNIQVYAVPSRWGGMIAGSPKVPSIFTTRNPQTWILKEDGSALESHLTGRISSLHYPETFEFFCQSLDKMFKLWNIKGIIWDEIKTLLKDFSPKAIENLGKDAPYEKHIEANVDFYSRVNGHIKKNHPNVTTNMFVYAHIYDGTITQLSKIKHLDYFGCDGRPWHTNDSGTNESGNQGKHAKTLLGSGERFITAAHHAKKKALWLIENHNMLTKDAELMKQRLPEITEKNIEHLIYYYYPRNLQDPDLIMNIVKEQIKNFRK